jgi:hypothetical protein
LPKYLYLLGNSFCFVFLELGSLAQVLEARKAQLPITVKLHLSIQLAEVGNFSVTMRAMDYKEFIFHFLWFIGNAPHA